MQEQTLINVLVKMGIMGQLISLLIFILSIIALYVFIVRFFTLGNTATKSSNFIDKIKESILSGNISTAKDLCIRNNSALSRVLLKGIQRLGQPHREIEQAMDNAINLEIFKLEKGENVLSLISKMAPMLGFIGTIAGVIQIFYTINTTGDYNIESISGGLYVKMITSALGLSLGILSYFFYFVISGKVKKSIYNLEKGSSDFMDILATPIK